LTHGVRRISSRAAHRPCISSRVSVYIPCGLMIYKTSFWWYAISTKLMIYTPLAWLRRENAKRSWIALQNMI
jgi:hypothetical protein